MKINKISLLLMFLALPFILLSQEQKANDDKGKEKKVRDHGLILLLGPALNYHYGPKGGDTAYNNNKISFQVDGQFGILSTRHQTIRGNFLGAFGSFGSISSDVLQEVATHAGREIIIKQKQFNQFYSVEAGMIIFNFLRLSGGIGRQFYEDIANNLSSIKYFSLTGGLNFNFGAVNLGVNANLLSGGDLIENQLRFSTGIMIKF
ncbi:MAG: hypothetical protein HGA23_00305 [Bacteroidales bacterium]|nr:hypothetical protein [Bacteroidales bacterium]